MSMSWPSLETLCAHAPIPPGVTLRAWTPEEQAALPALLRAWYPSAAVGAESVFLEPAFLGARVFVADGDFFVFAICQEGEVVGFQAFERQRPARTLHGRLAVLAPAARAGFLGALGFPLFEALGELTGAELLLTWVTLSTKIQQLMAERRGFTLCGLVPAVEVALGPDGRPVRVMEALYAKARVSGVWPDDALLTPNTRRVLAQLHRP